MATADRNFNQKRLTQIGLTSQITALVVMIVTGLATRSIWALVAGGLIAALVTTVLSHVWLPGHPNRLRLERIALSELIGFGKWIFVSSIVGVLAANGDRLLFAGLLAADVLGLYAIALLIVEAIQGGLSKLLMTVSLPALSEIARSNPSRLREIYYRFRIPADLVMLFLAGLLYVAGGTVVDLLYDSRYIGAGPMLETLSLSLIAIRYAVAYQLYLAIGRPQYLAAANVVRMVSLCLLVPTLYYISGLDAAIWGIALHQLASVPLVYVVNARLGLNDFRREFAVLFAFPIGLLGGYAINAV
jgi:O-antigen/teichoic acid export membrane protein